MATAVLRFPAASLWVRGLPRLRSAYFATNAMTIGVGRSADVNVSPRLLRMAKLLLAEYSQMFNEIKAVQPKRSEAIVVSGASAATMSSNGDEDDDGGGSDDSGDDDASVESSGDDSSLEDDARYLVVNETNEPLWFGQHGTPECVLLGAGSRVGYSWRTVQTMLSLAELPNSSSSSSDAAASSSFFGAQTMHRNSDDGKEAASSLSSSSASSSDSLDAQDDLEDGWFADREDMRHLSAAGVAGLALRFALTTTAGGDDDDSASGNSKSSEASSSWRCSWSRPLPNDYDVSSLSCGGTKTRRPKLKRSAAAGAASAAAAPSASLPKIPLFVSVTRRGLQTVVALRGAYCVRSSMPVPTTLRWRLVSRHAVVHTAVSAQFAAAAAAEAVAEAITAASTKEAAAKKRRAKEQKRNGAAAVPSALSAEGIAAAAASEKGSPAQTPTGGLNGGGGAGVDTNGGGDDEKSAKNEDGDLINDEKRKSEATATAAATAASSAAAAVAAAAAGVGTTFASPNNTYSVASLPPAHPTVSDAASNGTGTLSGVRSVFILAPIEHKASSLATATADDFSGAALDGPIASATAASAATAAASAATAATSSIGGGAIGGGVSVHSMLEGISSSVAAAAAAIASLGGGDDAYLMVQMRCGRRARDGNGNGAGQQQREEEEQLGEWSAPVMIGARSGNVAHDSLSFAGTGVWATPTAARAFAQGAAAVASGGSGVSGAVSAPQASHATDLLSTVANRFVQRCRSLAVASCRLQSST